MNSNDKSKDRKKTIMMISISVAVLLLLVLAIVLLPGIRDTGQEISPTGESVKATEGDRSTEPSTPEQTTAESVQETPTEEITEGTSEAEETTAEATTEEATTEEVTTEEATTAPPETTAPEAQPTEPTGSTPLPEPPTGSGQSGGNSGGQSTPTQAPPETEPPIIEEEIASGNITCDEFGSFSGQYVEDGRDELVENVAAARVTNHSDEFLEFAVITININGNPATFVATGLPAGSSAWVLEIDRMKIGDTASFEYEDCISSFRKEAVTQTDKLTITSNGNMLTVKNNTNGTLSNVYVYYKTKHTDGNYLGGITYRVDFGTLEAGASVEKLAGHYDQDVTEIVHLAWKTE